MTDPNSADLALAIARLARLSKVEYDRIRKAEAKTLGIRVTVLDAEVRAARLTAAIAEEVTETAAAVVDEFNTKYMVVNEAGKAIIYAPQTDPILGRSYFDRMGFDDLRKLFMNRSVVAGIGEGGIPVTTDAADAWLRSSRRRQYVGGIVFDPSGKRSDPDVLNLWKGFAIEPEPGSWDLLREHIRTVICKGESRLFDYLIGWLARMVQFPARQGEVAVALRGARGTGKGTLARALSRIMGQHGLAVSQSKHLVGAFNLHLRDCVFLFADEAFFAGDRANVGVLKSLITEETIPIEGKGANVFQAPNFLHVIMASNEGWVVPAALDERRFFVLDVGEEHKQEIPYFAAINKEMENGGCAAMLHELLRHDLRDFEVRAVPGTAALDEQKKLTLDTPESWWRDVLHRGYVFRSRLGLDDWFGQWHDALATEVLFDSYMAFARERHDRHPLDREAFGSFMVRMKAKAARPRNAVIGERLGAGREPELIRKDRAYGYHLGELSSARSGFIAATNLPVHWE